MTQADRWLGAMWPRVEEWLPPAPARVLEIGCGPLGGFVPMLRADGYEPIGVDPKAPEGDDYRRVAFEQLEPGGAFDAVIASASLHHVADPGEVMDRIADVLAPGGQVLVIEWDWEAFDQATADWCFARLGPSDNGHGWLRHHRDRWTASGRAWHEYLADWAREGRIHPTRELLALLRERFRVDPAEHGPYVFADLPQTSEAEERAAIGAGTIRATRVDIVCRRR